MLKVLLKSLKRNNRRANNLTRRCSVPHTTPRREKGRQRRKRRDKRVRRTMKYKEGHAHIPAEGVPGRLQRLRF